VVFGIGHHDDHPLFVNVSLAREAAAQGGDEVDGLFDVIDRDVYMYTDLAPLRLGNRLEHEPRLGVTALTQVHPATLRGPGLTLEQSTPKLRHTLGVKTVDRHARPDVRHRTFSL
jgi:hypothetical protein